MHRKSARYLDLDGTEQAIASGHHEVADGPMELEGGLHTLALANDVSTGLHLGVIDEGIADAPDAGLQDGAVDA